MRLIFQAHFLLAWAAQRDFCVYAPLANAEQLCYDGVWNMVEERKSHEDV